MHHQFQAQPLSIQHDIDMFFEKAKNGQISEHNSEEESYQDNSSRGNGTSGKVSGGLKKLDFILNNTGSNRKIPDQFLETQDQDLSCDRFKALPSVEASLVSDFLLSGSMLVGDQLNGTSRSRSEMLTSKDHDEIQKIRDEVKQIGLFHDLEVVEEDDQVYSRHHGKEDMLLMDMRFDTSRDLTSVNTSSRKILSSSRLRDLEEDEEELPNEYSAIGQGKTQRKIVGKNGEEPQRNKQSAAQIISRNMTTNSFYKQQNFFSDKSAGMIQEEHFTFQQSLQSDKGGGQFKQQQVKQGMPQPDKIQNAQTLNQQVIVLNSGVDNKQANQKSQLRNDEVNWDLVDLKSQVVAEVGYKSQISAEVANAKVTAESNMMTATTKSQVDTCYGSTTARTQSQVEKAKNQNHRGYLSINSQNHGSLSIDQKINSLNAAPSKKQLHDGQSKPSKLPPVASARRLQPIQYLSNKQTYFEKVKQCNRNSKQQPASSFATTTQSVKSSTNNFQQDGARVAGAGAAQGLQPQPLLLQQLHSSVSGDQISSNIQRSVENSARKPKAGPSSELQKFNDIFLDYFNANLKKDAKEEPEEDEKDEGVPCYGTFETQREKEDEAPPEPRDLTVERNRQSEELIPNGPSDQRQLTRRLLKSPEPNLPNYFSLKNFDVAARQSDVPNYDKGRSKQLPFDSREATPRLEDDLEKHVTVSDNVNRAGSLPCPLKKYNKEVKCMKKTKTKIVGVNHSKTSQNSKDRRSREIKIQNKKKTADFDMDKTVKDDQEVNPQGFRDDITSNDDYRKNSCGREIEIESKQANELIQQVRQTLNQRPKKMFKCKSSKHPMIDLAKTESQANLKKKSKTRNKELYSPIPQLATEWPQHQIRSDCVTPTGQHQLIANNYIAFKAACSHSSKKNFKVSAPEKTRKAVMKSKSPPFMKTTKKTGGNGTAEKTAALTTCPAEKCPDRMFSPMISVSLKEICDRVQIIQDRFMEPKNIIEECRVTIQNQMQVIIALLEQQIKYGIDKVGIQDEITNKKFDLDATMNLLTRLEVQQDKDRRLLGHGHPDLEEPKQLCLKYELIDKERLSWIRKHNTELEEKIQSLETKLRIYKRNEKYQFWGYYDVVADSQQKKRQECNSYDRKKQLDNKYVDNLATMDFKSPDSEQKTKLFQVSRYHVDQRETTDGGIGQSTCLEPFSVKSQKATSIISPNSRSTNAASRQQSLTNKVGFAQLTAKQGAITQQDINAVNKKLRELQHQIFVKDCQIKEHKFQFSELETQLRKERQQRQVESMEKDLKIQFLQNQIDQVYNVYKKKMKETDPGMKNIKTLGQRLMAEIQEIPELQKKKIASRRSSKSDNEPLMQLTGKILQKNHDLEQQIFALERQKEELLGLGLTTGGSSSCAGGNLGADDGNNKQSEQQEKIMQMQECIKVLSNIFVQQKEAEATNAAVAVGAGAASAVTSTSEDKQKSLKGKMGSVVGKELQLHRKKLSRDDPMRKKFISRDEEDFQKMLRSSITRSSVSSSHKQKAEPQHKRKKSRELPPQPIPIGQFFASINQNKQDKNSQVRYDSRNRTNQHRTSRDKPKNDKSIPQLFNESDTNLTKNDTLESQENQNALSREKTPDLQQATLADLILPKSKLNSQKNWISKQSPQFRNKAKQGQAEMRVFRQTRKCSNKGAFKYAVYPRNLDSAQGSEKNSARDSRKPPSKTRDKKSSDDSLKRAATKEQHHAKYVAFPRKQNSRAGLEELGSQTRVGSAIGGRMAGVSPHNIQNITLDDSNSQQMRSYKLLKDAENAARVAAAQQNKDKTSDSGQQQSKTRVSSQQMNKLRYLFQ